MSRATHISNDRLGRLASWCTRRRWRVVFIWATVFVVVTAVSMAAGGEHRVDYSMPGSESAAVRELLDQKFPERFR
jgi:putative drug exporter of the RND superfamily